MLFDRREFGFRTAAACSLLIASRIDGVLALMPTPAQIESQPIFYDDNGLIVHRNNDGGDTAQREGWYWFGVWVRENILKNPWPIPRKLAFPDVIRLLEPNGDGVFRRHPKYSPYDKQWGFSRDQMIPLVAAMGVWGLTQPLRRLWNALPQDTIGGTKHAFNGTWVTVFGQRTIYTGDVVTPGTINLFRRSWQEDPSNASDHNGPAGEQELLANAGLRCPPYLRDRDNTGNDLDLIVVLLMALLRFPSPSSDKALKWYTKNRLVSYGSFLGAYRQKYGELTTWDANVRHRFDDGIKSGWTTDSSRVYGAVKWYHRAQVGANPQLAELYGPIIQRFFE